MTKIILIALFLISSVQGAELVPQTEAFILEAKEDKLYIKVLNGPLKEKLLWVDYSLEKPSGKIFAANPIDKLASPTTSIKDALYIQFPFAVHAELDPNSLTPTMEKRMKDHLFMSLDRYVPISNQDVPDVAEDYAVSCPKRPKRKNGEYCHKATAFNLPSSLLKIVKEESQKVDENPALVASIIQHESLFDVFSENLHEKNKCIKDEKNCSPYRWGVGLAQLGQTDAPLYGVDWNKTIKRPKACKGKRITDRNCLKVLIKKCTKYKDDKLKPINCPRAAISAAAKKIAAMIPEKFPAWVKQDGKITQVELASELRKDPVETIRNKIGLYNRSVKVMNSFVEYFDQHGSFPTSYGSAWAQLRTPKSPSISMGYQMLTKEYINRCYVWELAGLCNAMPEHSLVVQYQKQFN